MVTDRLAGVQGWPDPAPRQRAKHRHGRSTERGRHSVQVVRHEVVSGRSALGGCERLIRVNRPVGPQDVAQAIVARVYYIFESWRIFRFNVLIGSQA